MTGRILYMGTELYIISYTIGKGMKLLGNSALSIEDSLANI